jgi:hypothetical protein
MPGESKITTDHNVIKQWVEERGGKPARIKGTNSENDPGLLRIDFPGYAGKESLEGISWDDFFRKFDEKNLAFLYQEKLRSGQESRFFKLISRAKEAAEKKEPVKA